MRTLYILWKSFYDICRLRSTPQNLPISNVLLMLLIPIYIIIGVIHLQLYFTIKQIIVLIVLDLSLLIMLVSSLLYFVGYTQRIKQTLTAIIGANCILDILSYPVATWLKFAQSGDNNLPSLLLISFIVWKLIIYAHILRHSIESSFFIGFILSIIIYILILSVLQQVVTI